MIGAFAGANVLLAAAIALLQAPQAGPAPAELPVRIEAAQLSVVTSHSPRRATLGSRVTLYVDVFPRRGMHVYAPEQKGGYIRIQLDVDDDPAFREGSAVFPKASDYYFEPLKETFKVFDAPFRIRQTLTLRATASMRRRASARAPLAVTGTLRYQACDDQVCYRPDEVKLSWTVELR
jgi:hypothetical protein